MSSSRSVLPSPVDTEAQAPYSARAGQEIPEELRRVVKGELHVHLNGLVPSTTIKTILAEEETELPAGFDLDRDLVRASACSSLAGYLTPWQVLRRLPRRQENLQRLADAAFHELAANNVRFVELRSSVLYLASLQDCSVVEALNRLIFCTGRAAKRFSIRRAIILTVTRGDYSAVHLDTLLAAYRVLGCPSEIVGIDLAGNEEIPYPSELPTMFREAKHQYGFGITVHAGETGRPENVSAAIELFDADRIGHGTAAGGDPWLMETLAKRNVCVEVCPISNRLTGAVSGSNAHPLREFQDHGVPFVICSDNPGIHQRGLSEDYVTALAEGVARSTLCDQYSTAKRYSFIKGLP